MSRSRRVVVAIIVGMAVLGACFAVYDSFMSDDIDTISRPQTVERITQMPNPELQAMKLKGDDTVYICSTTNKSCEDVRPGSRVTFDYWTLDNGEKRVVALEIE